MDARHIQLVRESLSKLAASDEALIDILASELLYIAPDVPSDRSATSEERQRRAIDMMTAALRSLDAPDGILGRLRQELGESGTAAIRQIDFDCAGNALLRALKKMLGPEFTSETWHAWVEALCALSDILGKTSKPLPKARELELA